MIGAWIGLNTSRMRYKTIT